MTTTRRDFIKQAAALSGAAGIFGVVPASIRRAMAIDPAPGSTFLDAEHVVILMQENRSFDHCFGALRGVRGFNDPRAITLPDRNPVWVQTNAKGERFAPFRLNIKDTKSTWMGSLPHSWTDQVDARNGGKYDRWLSAKQSGHDEYESMPLTMGYYTREDIPFYYELADAFTVCDQHFCSTLTGTTPNRLYLWTGRARAEQSPQSPGLVRNEDVDYGRWARWRTFPEILEDHGVPWKIYQNELSLQSGLNGEEDAWLANFTDNPIEWFSQYNVRFAATRRAFVEKRLTEIPGEIESLRAKLASADGEKADIEKRIERLERSLTELRQEREDFSVVNYEALSARAKSLHERAFCTNVGDPSYRQLTELSYIDGGVERRVKAPKGDVLHQFRQDVSSGKLPAVSWIVAPERFSDHPSSAWYGAWYLSEVMDILTQNPEVWKKTVFILTYDENDGYFDHVPPFCAPRPGHMETGTVSAGIDPGLEYVELEQDLKRKPASHARGGPMGLGYRVPMIVASPWSRGGAVCSQVFDHTSALQFLEKLLSHRTGKKIEETNMSRWRRAVCGDLTSCFGAADVSKGPAALERNAVIESIHRAKFKGLPDGYRVLTDEEVDRLRKGPHSAGVGARQEPGVRPSCALPYELVVNGGLDGTRRRFEVQFEARKDLFGDRSAGAPFIAYAFGVAGGCECRDYAVDAGASVSDAWDLSAFEGSKYDLRIYGPNGFFRMFRGDSSPAVRARVALQRKEAPGSLELIIENEATRTVRIDIQDNAYGNQAQQLTLAAGARGTARIDTQRSHGWYDISVKVAEIAEFEQRLAGRMETGAAGFSDPAMGNVS